MITLKDISEKTGYSVSVVSRALNHTPDKSSNVSAQTIREIRQAVEKLNYQPNHTASCLRKGKNPSIGIFMPPYKDSLIIDAMIGMSKIAARNNLSLNLHFGIEEDSLGFMDTMNDLSNSGVIAYYREINQEQLLLERVKKYNEQGGKVVFFREIPFLTDFDLEEHGMFSVVIDDIEGGRQAAEYLASLNCPDYVVIGGVSRGYKDRISGFRNYMNQRGLRNSEYSYPLSYRDYTPEIINKIITAHISAKPLGVFAVSDYIAMKIIQAAAKINLKIGKDIKLVGYNDSSFASFASPPLTTVVQPFQDAGTLAMQMLIDMLGRKKVKSKAVKPSLVIRESA